jgi:hypothetical protein
MMMMTTIRIVIIIVDYFHETPREQFAQHITHCAILSSIVPRNHQKKQLFPTPRDMFKWLHFLARAWTKNQESDTFDTSHHSTSPSIPRKHTLFDHIV